VHATARATRTQVFLWPVGAILVALPFAVLSGFNPTRFVLGIYFSGPAAAAAAHVAAAAAKGGG
jgi:hypothetical protein